MKENDRILFVSTADTDTLSAVESLKTISSKIPKVEIINIHSGWESRENQQQLFDAVLASRVVVLRLLGGKQAIPESFDHIVQICNEQNVPLIACPGHQEWDQDLIGACTASVSEVETVFGYLMHGGMNNLRNMFLFLSDVYFDTSLGHDAPEPMPWEGIYRPGLGNLPDIDTYMAEYCDAANPTIGLLFYRAHWMSGNLDFIDSLITEIESKQANVIPIFTYSLKHSPDTANEPDRVLSRYLLNGSTPRVNALINTMGLSMVDISDEGLDDSSDWVNQFMKTLNVPVIQAIISTDTRQAWEDSELGLSPIDTAMNVALPEFDGRIISVPISFKELEEVIEETHNSGYVAKIQKYVPEPSRIKFVAGLAINWANLNRKSNKDRKVVIVMSNYPTKDARIGNAVGLDTPASVVNLLNAMTKAGYKLSDIPSDGDELVHRIIERCSNDRDFLTEQQLQLAAGHVESGIYQQWFNTFEDDVKATLENEWDAPPGSVYRTGDSLAIAGIDLGNVFVGLQPPRGFGENPISIYHSPDLAPTHHYVAYYRWIKDVYKADAIIHVGKHGTLEWLPGKGVGMSPSCFPEVVLSDMPMFYSFIINNPGEGTQAKRRIHATIVDHLIPAMTTADTYGDIQELEQLLDEHYQCQTLDPGKIPMLEGQIWEVIERAELNRDLGVEAPPEEFGDFMLEVDGYLCEIKDIQIKDGLHTLGEPPQGEQLTGLLASLTRLDMGGLPSIRRAISNHFGLDYEYISENLSDSAGSISSKFEMHHPSNTVRTNGDVIESIEQMVKSIYSSLQDKDFARSSIDEVLTSVLGKNAPQVSQVAEYVCSSIYPNLMSTTDEIDNLIEGLEGKFIPAGPSGAPTRGMPNVLPTGRNFYSVDPKSLPSPAAWEVGKNLGDSLLQKYLDDEGDYPEMVGIVVWGTSAMRTHGDDIAQILYLLGVKPVWQQESRRIVGIEAIDLKELGRPRIDVTVRISGFFRDAFPNLVNLIDQAVQMVANLDESPEDNYVKKHLMEDKEKTDTEESTDEEKLFRIFGSKPGSYGAGILPLLDEQNWSSVQDLAEVYTAWGGFAYTEKSFGVEAKKQFSDRFSQIVIAAKNQDNREHDIFDSDDYMQYHGGMIATVRALTGSNPSQFFGDSSDPSRVKTRDLQDESRRVFRSRVVNPKWIESMTRHGYKGAFELSATVDYMFGYDATSQVIEDWMYRDLTESYVLDPAMQEFFKQSNPWALRSIVERLLEAVERDLWENPDPDMLAKLQEMYLDIEEEIESRQE